MNIKTIVTSSASAELLRTILSESGATKIQINQYIDYQKAGNKKGQERILCRCKGMQKVRVQPGSFIKCQNIQIG